MNKLIKLCNKAYPNEMVEVKVLIDGFEGYFSLRLQSGITLYEGLTLKELIKEVKKDV